MKPKNFPQRKLRRVARAKLRDGLALTEQEQRAAWTPTDIRIRPGAAARRG